MTAEISTATVARFAPRCDAVVIAGALAPEAARCEITTPLRVAHWMAQMFVECGGFTRFEEDLDYTVADLMRVWPGRFLNAGAAQPYAHQPQALANLMYSARNGNGARETGDGWRFRGRGFLMRTFRGGYAQAAVFTGLDLVNNPDLLATDRAAAAADSAHFWLAKGINALADDDDIIAVTRAVNGGVTGLQDRRDALTRAKGIWA